MEEILIEKVRQRTFLYDTKSPDYRDQHESHCMGRDREGVEDKTFYVSSCDVRIVSPAKVAALGRATKGTFCTVNRSEHGKIISRVK